MTLLFAAGLVLSSTTAEDLLRGRALYEDTLYPEAVAVFDELLAKPNLPADQRQQALLYLGFSQVGLKHEESARHSFRDLLREHPNSELPAYTSPKIKKIFESVRQEVLSAREISPASVPASVPVAGLALSAPQERSTAKKYWWLWTGISAVGAAAIVTVVYFAIPHPASYGDLHVHFQAPP